MVLALYILAFLALVGLLYLLNRWNKGKKETITIVHSGAIDYFDTPSVKIEPLPERYAFRNEKGDIIDTTHYYYFKVIGELSSECKIKEGDSILVERIITDNVAYLKTILREGDIMMLYIKDSNGYRIRMFERWEGDNIRTFYYVNGKEIHGSSSVYSTSTIKGIVRYVVGR